ncbi:MAG: hypothetical protein LBG61_00600, partial [Burkholderiales bacterium]|nr:hypothetical protein [Burkholderiales bacterium]
MKLQKGLNTQRKASWLGASLGFLMMSAAAYGATVLSDIPVASESVTPPTIVFTADDSGSMLRTYTPEAIPKIEGGCPTPTDSQGTCVTDIQDAVSGDPADIFQKGQPPMLAAAFNGLAYNPAVEYRPPMKGDGTSYPNQTNYSYVGWPSDLDNWGTGKPQPVNLKDKKYSYKKSVLEGLAKIYNFTIPSGYDDGTNYNLPPHYFVASFKWCSSSLSTNCVDEYDTQHQVPQYSKGKFELVVLDFKSGMISDELTNYANWVAYYRSRAAASKTVASLAFNDAVCHLGDKDCEAAALPYVTYMSINNTSPATPARFSGADRTAFSKTLLSTTIKGGTPLTRVANEVGQLFRNSNTYIRNSCHRNYHIMFTDGLWNTWSTTVGDVDGAKVPQSFPVASLETPYGTLIPGKDWPNPIRDTHKNDSTLSDIALYYWMTDLRPNEPNNVLPTTADPATWQHLNFVGMGFGVRGTLTAQDVENIKNGISGYQWPSIPTGSMTTASVDYIQTVDDLWHASFNGFGKYVATDSPDIFGNELYSILRGILTMGSTRTGLSLTSPLIAKGDVYSYSASFTSATEGEIVKKSMDAEG